MDQITIYAFCVRCMNRREIRAWIMAGAIRKATIECNCKPQPAK